MNATSTPGVTAFYVERRTPAYGDPVAGVLVFGGVSVLWRLDGQNDRWGERQASRVKLGNGEWVSLWGSPGPWWWMKHAERIGEVIRGLAWSHNGRRP